MRTIRYLTAILLIAPLVSYTGARRFASHERVDAQTFAQKWDLNHDSNITCEEWNTYRVGLFQHADVDHDTFLSAEEFYHLATQERIYTRITLSTFDQNNDARVSFEEFTNRPNTLFARLDTNSDCLLTQTELQPAQRQGGRRGGGRGQRRTF